MPKKPKPSASRSRPASVAPPRSGDVERILRFEEDSPFKLLGPHYQAAERRVVIRAFLPRAQEAWVRRRDGSRWHSIPMQRLHEEGLFQAVFADEEGTFAYRLRFREPGGYEQERADPYAFGGCITDFDLYLIGEGNHFQSYEKFGARPMRLENVDGVHFAVWAPNAASVSVVGDFNRWQAGAHPLARIQSSAVWGLFIPGLKAGELYKLALRSKLDGRVYLKADPYALQAELRPQTASVVADLGRFRWQDANWLQQRAQCKTLAGPVAVYEVHLGSWRRDVEQGGGFLSYRELARQLVEYALSLGYTHLELMPVMEHPLDESWGYQVINYYAPTSRFGRPEDFMYFVDYCHRHGLGVILDWVPAHFPKDEHGLNLFDGGQIYASGNWRRAEQKEWGTLVFDFGRNEVRNFLISNALFWLERYHIDGLRVDAVASMLYLDYARRPGEWEANRYGGRENLEAVEFLKKFNHEVHARHPGVLTLAEESTAWPGVTRPEYTGGLGFDLKWNMGWMHDTLEYFSRNPAYRKFHQGQITFSLLYAFTERFMLPLSHDEVVYGKRALLEKMPGDDWQKFANLRLLYGYLFGHPGKKLLFMGNDFAQRAEWNCGASLDWHLLREPAHQGVQRLVQDLLHLHRREPPLHEWDFDSRGFEWIDFSDQEQSVLSFIRWAQDYRQLLFFAFNFTPVPRWNYRLGVPKPGFYREILNTDAREYGGSGLGNRGGLRADLLASHGRPCSLNLVLPPLAAVVFRLEADE